MLAFALLRKSKTSLAFYYSFFLLTFSTKESKMILLSYEKESNMKRLFILGALSAFCFSAAPFASAVVPASTREVTWARWSKGALYTSDSGEEIPIRHGLTIKYLELNNLKGNELANFIWAVSIIPPNVDTLYVYNCRTGGELGRYMVRIIEAIPSLKFISIYDYKLDIDDLDIDASGRILDSIKEDDLKPFLEALLTHENIVDFMLEGPSWYKGLFMSFVKEAAPIKFRIQKAKKARASERDIAELERQKSDLIKRATQQLEAEKNKV